MISKLPRRASLATASMLAVSAVAVGVAPAATGRAPLALTVTKDATTSLTRTHNWTIDTSVDKPVVVIHKGRKARVNYTVKVAQGTPATTDSNFMVAGTITIKNPSATDNQQGQRHGRQHPDSRGLRQGVPIDLAAAATLKCSYKVSLPTGATRTNTPKVETTADSKGGGQQRNGDR